MHQNVASIGISRQYATMKTRKKKTKTPQKRDSDATRAKILQAALAQFSEKGLSAASTDDIAARCKVNKRMIYYYFGSKEGLYLAALESVFENLVALEKTIEVEHLDPPKAIAAMINLKIDYYLNNPHFVSFITMENFYKARYLRTSKKLELFKTPLTQVIARILKRGERSGQFRKNIEAVDFYVLLSGLCIMHFSNQYSLGAIFGRDMMAAARIEQRRQTVVDFALGYLTMPGARLPPPTRRGRKVLHPLAS